MPQTPLNLLRELAPRAGLFLVLIVAGPGYAFVATPSAQTPKKIPKTHTHRARHVNPNPAAEDAALELQKRVVKSQAALQSGDPAQISAAEAEVLAVALREMGELRMAEDANAQAVELLKQSLTFEETPVAHRKLALAYLRAKQSTNAIQEVEKATLSAPGDVDAWKIEAHAWMQQGDYRKATEAFARVLKLHGDLESAYSLGICFLNLHAKDKTKMVFQDIISNYGNQGPLHVLFGRAYRDANELDDAIHEFRLAIAVRPNTPYAHYFLGLALLMKREWGPPNDEIRGLIKAELKRAPRDFLSNYLMGMFASADKNFVEADRYLSVAADVNPSWPDPWLLMGQNAYDQHDFRRAQPLLEKAVALTGSDESRNHYQIRKAYIDLGRIAQEADRKEAGAEYFRKARELQQRNLQQSQQAVATVVSSGGGAAGMGAVMPLLDSREEEPVAPGLAALDPTAQIDSTILARANLTPEQQRQATAEEQLLRNVLGSSFNDLATSEAHRQQFSLALGHFQQAERWNPEVPGLLRNLGAAAFKVADHGEACRSLSKVLDSNPQDNVVRAMLGLSYFMTGAYGLAAQTLAPLSETALSDPALAYPWAESLVKTQNFAEAAKILDHIEQQQVSADTLVLVGEARNEMTDYAGALKAVHRALELNPSLPRAHFNAGLAYLRSAHPSEAATEFESELALNPGDSEAKYNLAYAYLQQSQRDKAVPLLEQVLAANPANADAQYQMGKLLLDENNVNNAIEHLEAAVRLSPEKDYVHYQLQSAYRKAARVQDADRELQLYKQAKNHKSTPDGNSPAQNQ